jgi:hypothetical protein
MMPSEYEEYARRCDWETRHNPPPKGSKCIECGAIKDLVPINTVGDYVCRKCWMEEGYEYDPTPP